MRFSPSRLLIFSLPFISTLIALHAAPADEKFTLEEVMSAPFVSELTAAPAGGRVAWIANEQGRRNIWVAQLGSHASAQQITHYTQDDGQEISGLAWSTDGEWLAYTRGGDAGLERRRLALSRIGDGNQGHVGLLDKGSRGCRMPSS